MTTARNNRAQIFIVGFLLLLILLLAILGVEAILSGGEQSPIQGEPQKDPSTALYTVHLLVSGHRDLTILHRNLRANIHVDFVSYYFASTPETPSGRSILDFSKPVHVTITVKSSILSTNLLNTFDMVVSLGARCGRAITYNLPSGTYTIEAQGIDQDGFTSSATTQLILP
jgi:hypothetical protein